MLWSTLKNKIAQYVKAHPENAGSQTILAIVKASDKEVAGYLDDFDIREVGNLRKVIPGAFPKPLRSGALMGELNIHGAWRVKVHDEQAA